MTKAGIARLRVAAPGWGEAYAKFEEAFGRRRSSDLRDILREVVASELRTGNESA